MSRIHMLEPLENYVSLLDELVSHFKGKYCDAPAELWNTYVNAYNAIVSGASPRSPYSTRMWLLIHRELYAELPPVFHHLLRHPKSSVMLNICTPEQNVSGSLTYFAAILLLNFWRFNFEVGEYAQTKGDRIQIYDKMRDVKCVFTLMSDIIYGGATSCRESED